MILDRKSNLTYDDVTRLFNELKLEFKNVEKNLEDSVVLCHEEIKLTH